MVLKTATACRPWFEPRCTKSARRPCQRKTRWPWQSKTKLHRFCLTFASPKRKCPRHLDSACPPAQARLASKMRTTPHLPKTVAHGLWTLGFVVRGPWSVVRGLVRGPWTAPFNLQPSTPYPALHTPHSAFRTPSPHQSTAPSPGDPVHHPTALVHPYRVGPPCAPDHEVTSQRSRIRSRGFNTPLAPLTANCAKLR
jgi:hypothetical protein